MAVHRFPTILLGTFQRGTNRCVVHYKSRQRSLSNASVNPLYYSPSPISHSLTHYKPTTNHMDSFSNEILFCAAADITVSAPVELDQGGGGYSYYCMIA